MTKPDHALLEGVIHRIVSSVHPLRIILFGSASRHEMGPDSDLDLLVVMPAGIHHRQVARRVYQSLRGLPLPKDIVVVTEEDIQRHGQDPSLVLFPAMNEGREIYPVL